MTASTYEALGQAMARWQYVETALYFVAHAALGTREELSSVVFYQVKSPTGRYELVCRLLEQALSAEDFDAAWKPLAVRLQEAIEARNRLAHFEMLFDQTTGETVLAALHHDIRARQKVSRVAYRAPQLEIAGRVFLELSAHLLEFVDRHFGPRALPGKFAGPIPPRSPGKA